MHNDLFTLVKEARNFLAYHHRLGITSYPAGDALLAFLRPTARPERPAAAPPRPPLGPARQTTPAAPLVPVPSTESALPAGYLTTVRAGLGGCTRCHLHEKRQNLVFGEGNPHPLLMVIGDWPGSEDARTGRPFQGQDGEMLTKMFKAIDLQREEVYVTTLVKCQPPAGRPPTRDEIAACLPFLLQQIVALAPRVICAMGSLATQTLLVTDQPLTRLRGGFHDCHGVALMPTFHPRFLHEHPEMKKATWQDLLMIRKKLVP
ncbi:MAG: hypothetical protein COZ12_02915 [Deltaproteobacteria bacterium CG_4_10_14_3_um_filter_60_8]|nr:MAG: hypothetical protein COX17_03220 [Deltaproteobacteria bacterium CG23_combo_of_CG06-09_8_20_14_all_60_8]PIY22615.1 MAG: hypothetical protein COZ12_02915 [Deltaproteobacteria bacterium CG_4_10_14_3_um_filter_60_8]